MATKIKTATFLPQIFQTPTNQQFLGASLDVITQQPILDRVEGYVGSKNAPLTTRDYVPEQTRDRTNYQLDPGIVFTKPQSSTARDYITYPELIDALRIEGGITDNHNRLWSAQFYSWDSLVNLDMIVNYNQYYWLPDGPLAVTIQDSRGATIRVDDIIGKKSYTSVNGVEFTNGLKVAFIGDTFPTAYENNQYYVEGVGSSIVLVPVKELVAPEVFTQDVYIPWDVRPWDMTVWDARLYVPLLKDYITINRASTDRNGWSRSNMWFHIDVIKATEKYTGEVDYVNNTATRANKAERPIIEFYPNMRLFNSGTIGLKAIDFYDTRALNAFTEVAGQNVYYPDVQTYTKNYPSGTAVIAPSVSTVGSTSTTITVPTVDITGTFRVGQYITDSAKILPLTARVTSVQSVGTDTILGVRWTSAVSVLVPISGVSLVANDGSNGQYQLFDGARIVFASDQDITVRSKVWVARLSNTGGGGQVFTLSLATDGNILPDSQTVAIAGYNYYGKNFKWNGTQWSAAQQKTNVNQEPLYDLYDSSGVSFSDTTLYPGTNFAGSTLFQFARGSGSNDPVLGFPLRYNSIDNIGDIMFDVNLNSGAFTWLNGSDTVSVSYSTGYVDNYGTVPNSKLIGWIPAAANSVQYQYFDLTYTTGTAPTYTADIPAQSTAQTVWPAVTLYIDGLRRPAQEFTYTVSNDQTSVSWVDPGQDVNVTIGILSDVVSGVGYYGIPLNLQNNPLNVNITLIATGDLREHYTTIYYNSGLANGPALGANNYRDSGNLTKWGTKIIKNTASLVLPAALNRNSTTSLWQALDYNAREYESFRNLLLNTVYTTPYSTPQSAKTLVDDALEIITASLNESGPFFWSDMLPSKVPYATATYKYSSAISSLSYNLSRVYDYTVPSYYGVLVYRTTTVNGYTQVIQLVKDRDYTVSATIPQLVINAGILAVGDQITINEYNQTYGSYVPNTPTKLGLYPATIPHVELDDMYANPTYWIVGHDGSYTKLWGNYDPATDILDDDRDRALLEFETRIYNNLKLPETLPLNVYSVLPGFGRNTGYTYNEWMQLYTPLFLQWCGANNITDYQSQTYAETNEFTWNYRDSGNKVNGASIDQGYWRGLYLYLYDTTRPDLYPWQLLQYTNKPTWWETRYGVGPYTDDNTVLWQDLAAGYDWNNGNPRTITTAIRPNLLQYIPTDSYGKLVSPFVSFTGNYTIDYRVNRTFRKPWDVGDIGPTEWSYRRSPTWRFDLVKIAALQRPANFFNLAVDLSSYTYDSTYGGYLINGRGGLQPSDITLYGSGTPATSYLNWIIDWTLQSGVDATSDTRTLLDNLDVRLIYRCGGFTDKRLLQLFVERSAPGSSASSLLISDDSYSVLLHNNTIFERVYYSSVVVQITSSGYRIDGYSQTAATFPTLQPQLGGSFTNITVEGLNVTVTDQWTDRVISVPYGTEFYDIYNTAQFLMNYGAYLQSRGMIFEQIENGVGVTWRQMVAEFLYWAASGWAEGSIITLNPAAKALKIERAGSVVQQLGVRAGSFVLNQNLYPIASSNTVILRESNSFSLSPLNSGDTVSYGVFNLTSWEHGVVLDNITQFNDLVYDPSIGSRQIRITIRGYISGDWNGSIDAPGFVLNDDNVGEWDPNTVYTVGQIVKYKNRYWIAPQIIQPGPDFDQNVWRLTDYNLIRRGLLPNASTSSAESERYYDINNANLEDDANLLAFSLIGFRPRRYAADADLTDITQVNVYRNMLPLIGTRKSTDLFRGVELTGSTVNYELYENWAILSGQFGGVLNSNWLEMQIDGSTATGNPTIIQLVDGTIGYTDDPNVNQHVELSALYNWGRKPTSVYYLPVTTSTDNLFPTAGYVNFNDVRLYAYDWGSLQATPGSLQQILVGDILWLADWRSNWVTWTPVSTEVMVTTILNDNTGLLTFVTNLPHNLSLYQPLMLSGFSDLYDGYWIVLEVTGSNTVVVGGLTIKGPQRTTGLGVLLTVVNRRVQYTTELPALSDSTNEWKSDLAWIDSGIGSSWAVLRKSLNYKLNAGITLGGTTAGGTAVATLPDGSVLFSDPSAGVVYRVSSDGSTLLQTLSGGVSYGTNIAHNGSLYAITQTTVPTVDMWGYVSYNGANILMPIGSFSPTACDAIALSGDGRWLFVSQTSTSTVFPYTGGATLTGTIAGASFIGTVNGTTLNVDTVSRGTLAVGQQLTGVSNVNTSAGSFIIGVYYTITVVGNTDFTAIGAAFNTVGTVFLCTGIGGGTGRAAATVTPGTTITALGSGTGGSGTYTLSAPNFVGSGTFSTGSNTLNVTTVTSGRLRVGAVLWGNDVDPGVTITAFGTGTGGSGTYTISTIQFSTATNFNTTLFLSSAPITTPTSPNPPIASSACGSVIATNRDGTVFAAGAPLHDNGAIADVGAVYTWRRVIQNFEVQTSGPQTYTLITASSTTSSLLWINGVLYTSGYTVVGTTLTITMILAPGDLVMLETRQWISTATYLPQNIGVGSQFGRGIAYDSTGTQLLIGSPYEVWNGRDEGSVYHYYDSGALWGTISGTTTTAVTATRTLLINGYAVTINGATVTGEVWGGKWTASFGGTIFVGSIVGTTLTASSFSSGVLVVGSVISGPGVAVGTTITAQLSGPPGGVGTYTVSIAGAVAATTLSATSNRMTVTAISAGTITSGQAIIGPGITAGTVVGIQLSGSPGGPGIYTVNIPQTVTSTAVTGGGTTLNVTAWTRGRLRIGQTITGAGIPGGTTISALGTGTGAVGTYTISTPLLIASTTITGAPAALYNASEVAADIVIAAVSNVTATATAGILTIKLIDPSLGTAYSRLILQGGNYTVLSECGFVGYSRQRIIYPPLANRRTSFGYVIRYNNTGSVIIGAPTDSRRASTTFDTSVDGNPHNDTVFDLGATTWVDTTVNAGAVYMYDTIGTYNIVNTTPPVLVYAQSLNDTAITVGQQPYYGRALDFYNSTVVVGSPGWTNGLTIGRAVIYLNSSGASDWATYRTPQAIVDVSRINSVQLYDSTDYTTMLYYDHLDPMGGRLLGVVHENLDYISPTDPATYVAEDATSNTLVWGSESIGKTWFDTSLARWIDYHQNDIVYNSRMWGTIFPGSQPRVYTWVESAQPPVSYSGLGTPRNTDQFSVHYTMNAAGALVALYYFWVRGSDIVNYQLGKTLSDTVLEAYITVPSASGISYIAGLNTNTVALYNTPSIGGSNSMILHIGYSNGTNGSIGHVEYDLIRGDYADDFLSGFPPSPEDKPQLLYAKFIDSLSGIDVLDQQVPDSTLPPMLRTGVQIRPRQSMLRNRLQGMYNYLTYVNNVLSKFPIVESKEFTYLFLTGIDYDVTAYWEYINWWVAPYNDSTKASILLDFYYQLTDLSVTNGTVARINNGFGGRAEWYAYINNTWTRIGVERGTIKFLSTLWSTNNSGVYPQKETRWVIRSINEQLFIEEMLIYRNTALMIMFQYMISEARQGNEYLPWLNKTSFIDVEYSATTLKASQSYVSDNQSFLSGYINEVKPYHTVLKEFTLKYDANDIVYWDMTDFDLPATWNASIGQWITPQYVNGNTAIAPTQYLSTDPIWQQPEYINWHNNWGFELANKSEYPIGILASNVRISDTTIAVSNPDSYPPSGTITIDSEQIQYTSIDRVYGILSGLTRGANSTTVSTHTVNTTVYIELPAVVVLQTGRGYTTTPNSAVYLDPALYPQPRTPASITPVLSGDRVISITLNSGGNGYQITPQIVVQPALVIPVTPADIDIINNVITLSTLSVGDLLTGDILEVDLPLGSTLPQPLVDNGRYVARVITTSPTVIALYRGSSDAALDLNRIDLLSTGTIGFNLTFGCLATVGYVDSRVREIKTVLGYDRVTYTAKPEWITGGVYGSVYPSESSIAVRPVIKYTSVSGTTLATLQLDLGWSAGLITAGQLNRSPFRWTKNGASILGFLKAVAVDRVEVYLDYDLTYGVPASDFGAITYYSGFGTVGPTLNSFSGYLVGDQITASISGTTMTVTASTLNGLQAGAILSGTGILPGTTIISQIGGAPGGVGTYTVQPAQTAASTTVTATGYNLIITNVLGGTLSVGDTVTGTGMPPNTTVVSQVSGVPGGVGVYTVDASGAVGTGGGITLTVVNTQITLTSGAQITGYIDDNSTPTIYSGVPGNRLTVTATTSAIVIGMVISAPGIPANTAITGQLIGVPGGVGIYTVNNVLAQPVTVFTGLIGIEIGRPISFVATSTVTGSIGGTTLIVTAANPGDLAAGYQLIGSNVITGTTIAYQVTPLIPGETVGGIGRYVVTVAQTVASGPLLIKTVDGISLYDTYYVKDISGGVLTLTGGAQPYNVAGTVALEWGTGYLYSTVPLAYSADTVMYNGYVWECLVGNSDTVFDFAKWRRAPMTAPDRIIGQYSPTSTMPGVDLSLLMTGVSNPLMSYSGSPYSPQFPVDYIIQDYDWARLPGTATNIIQGATFSTGYGPEEMVPGITSDLTCITVVSNDATLSFRITVEKSGYSTVHNVNPYTQTTLQNTLTRVDDTTDILVVDDVTKVVEIVTLNDPANPDLTSDATGTCIIGTTIPINMAQVAQLSVSAGTWVALTGNSIKVTGLPPNTVLATTVTIVYGNLLYINYEFIGFTNCSVDVTLGPASPTPAVLTGLRRGLLGSSINATLTSGMLVQSVLARDQLPAGYPTEYAQNWWYGAPSSAGAATTLATNGSPAALILQRVV